MNYPEKIIPLKDGRSCILRVPRIEDAAALLENLRQITRETEYLLRTFGEADAMTIAQEEQWVRGMVEDPNVLLLVAEVDGEIAGSCEIRFLDRVKTAHRAMIGIGLLQKYWNLGIGTAMFREMLAEAERRGTMQVELDVYEENERARALYEKMGFVVCGVLPNAFLMNDGSYCREYRMIKTMK